MIDNLQADGDYYARATLPLRVGEQDELWRRIAAAREETGAADDDAKRSRLA